MVDIGAHWLSMAMRLCAAKATIGPRRCVIYDAHAFGRIGSLGTLVRKTLISSVLFQRRTLLK